MIIFTAEDNPTSTTPKNIATAMVRTNTTPVDCRVACRVGQDTRLNSDVTSAMKFLKLRNMFTDRARPGLIVFTGQ